MVKIFPFSILCQYNKIHKYELDNIFVSQRQDGSVYVNIESESTDSNVCIGLNPDDARALARELLLTAKYAEEDAEKHP